jgi:HlyD family secretion protein
VTASAYAAHLNSIRRQLFIGVGVVVLLFGGVGGWAATTEIAGAVIAPGVVVVESNVKRVQHPSGGIVGAIFVRDGSVVEEGDVLLRLDETLTRASLAIVTKTQIEMTARRLRLEAERDGLSDLPSTGRATALHVLRLAPDPGITPDATLDADVSRILEGERRLLEVRLAARRGQKQQLAKRIEQLGRETEGLSAQLTAKNKEIEILERELVGARDLFNQGLMLITKLTALERESARLYGEKGALQAAIAQTEGRASEIELQILQIDRDMASEVSRELRDVEARLGELAERRAAAEDQLRRTDIRAPQSGIVHQSRVHTVGGVIGPSETLMVIVPRSDRLRVDARVSPETIDRLRVGHLATIRFTAFSQRTTPEVVGRVQNISADTTTDERTGLSYYLVQVQIDPDAINGLGEGGLVPGMPAEVFLKTGYRTVASYLAKPLYDHAMRAFRER